MIDRINSVKTINSKAEALSKFSNRVSVSSYSEKMSDKNPVQNIQNQSFKGASTGVLTGLRGLNNSPAVGACCVDLCSMVIPRTVVEIKNRGAQSGIETFFREASSCFIHACVGLIGLGAATLMSGKFNDKYKVKAQDIFASGDTIKNMSSIWENAQGNSQKFFDGFLDSIKGLSGSEWKIVSKEARPEVIENLIKLSAKTKELASESGIEKKELSQEIKNIKRLVIAQITKDTGAQVSYKIQASETSKVVSSSLSELVDNAVSLSNSFKTVSGEKLPEFIKALAKNKTLSTGLGLGICAALCVSIQPLNRYLTKLRTGRDGFVGVENKGADDSKEFKTLKTIFGIGFPVFAISTIGKLSDIASNVQFNSKIPSLNQFKLLYGLTIGSRFLAARDKNELRESVIKDTLGFTNWLILGGMVSKLTARISGGSELINNPVAAENGKKGLKYAAKWLMHSSVKSFDEVLLPKVQEISKDGKMLKFSEIFKKADNLTKTKIMKIAGAQIAGYLYSGIVLGVGISKLNIFITRKLEAKKNAYKQMQDNTKNCGIDYFTNIKSELSTVFKEFS